MNLHKFLTIVIPTYNREKQLQRLLKSIERQNAIEKYYIVILNNHSNYDVEGSVKNTFPNDFINNIEIYNRPYNAGGDYNISSAFLFAKTDYLWIIGDDDEVLDGCFDVIGNDIIKYPEIPYFKYHIENHSTYKEDVLISNIGQFKQLSKKKYFSAGDIIFLSNNIYNLKKVGDYISSSLYYSYCSIPHSLPMLRCLIDETPFLLSHQEIIRYYAPEGDHWNFIKIVTSLSTVLDINYKGRYDVVRSFFYIISQHFRIISFWEECLKISDRKYRHYICRKGMMTLFARKSFCRYFGYPLFLIESILGIKVLTLYNHIYNSTDNYVKLKKQKLKESDSFVYHIYKKYLKNV